MAAGQVTITTTKPGPGLAITAWIGGDGPTVTGGFGGWEIIARPRRTAITQWRGREPIQMELPLVIDGYTAERGSDRVTNSVEMTISRLERMAQPHPPIVTPPQVRLEGSSANLIPHDDLDWVIVALEFGSHLRNQAGNRVRQEVTVGLLSHVGVEKLKISAAKQKRQKAGRS